MTEQKQYVYLDNAATTKVLPQVLQEAQKYFDQDFYNPSALYGKSIQAARVLKNSRQTIASILGVDENTIIFTSSGTESDNQALFCSRKKKNSKIIVSEAEHSAVYNSALELKQRGFNVVVVPVDEYGRVMIQEFESALDESVSLVSIMHVNNVTGAVNDIKKLVEITKAKSKEAIFHSDGVQALGKIKVKPKELGVDMYSVSSHKLGALKGSGFLYVKQGVRVNPLLYGGGQERGLRSSTENVSAIVGLAKALEIANQNYSTLENKSKEFFAPIRSFIQTMDDAIILTPQDASPQTLCLAFKNVRGETLMHAMEEYGYLLGIGSACSSKKGTPRIPKALGLKEGYKEGMLRISINAYDDYDSASFISDLGKCLDTLKKYVRI